MLNRFFFIVFLFFGTTMYSQVQLEVDGNPSLQEDLIISQVNYNGSQDVKAIIGHSVTNPGFGIGGRFTGGYKGLDVINEGQTAGFTTYGIYSSASGTSGTRIGLYTTASGTSGTRIGLYATASGTSGTKIGLYAKASGGSNNLAAQFGPGQVEVQNNLRVGTTSSNGRLHVKNINTLFGSKATATEVEVSHNGTAVTQGIKVSASNSGTGATYGLYSIASNTSTTGIAHAIRAEVNSPEDWAIYSIGKNYFNEDVRIGTQLNPDGGIYKLIVDGRIITEEVRVQNSSTWPDYVFEEEYDLLTIDELEAEILSKGHLPGIPSASEIEENGIQLGDMQIRMMEKIEELTLYTIKQQKEIDALKEKILRD